MLYPESSSPWSVFLKEGGGPSPCVERMNVLVQSRLGREKLLQREREIQRLTETDSYYY